MNYTPEQLLAMFFVYAVLGWCTEVAYAAVCTGKFVNRGFLNGPACPIYGFGAVLIVLLLTPVQDNVPLLFLGAVVVTSALEYGTGYVLEKIFHERWWDYSDLPFNLSGYVCLKFSLLWGLACLLVMKMLHPTILLFIGLVPTMLLRVLLALSAAVVGTDLFVTVVGIQRMRRRLRLLGRLAEELHELSDDVGRSISDNVLAAMDAVEDARDALDEKKFDLELRRAEFEEKLNALETENRLRVQKLVDKREELRRQLSTYGRLDRRLLRAFPNLNNPFNRAGRERLRERFSRK